MTTPPAIPATLIIGIGNPSRGDDALGPLLIERLEALALPDVELLTDFQLQVEYALDLQGRDTVIFVDAAVAGPEPYRFEPVAPGRDTSFSSHELSPSALLHAYEQLYGPSPRAYILAIRGYVFDLGAAPSRQAGLNLDAAMASLLAQVGLTPRA